MGTAEQSPTYSYLNDDPQVSGTVQFTVGPVGSGIREINDAAFSFQRLMYIAWLNQYEDDYSPEEIARTVNPKDIALKDEQARRIAQSLESSGQPIYMQAVTKIPSLSERNHTLYDHTVGVGKSNFAGKKNEYADLSNVYVDPEYQARGIGSAILHHLLDGFPEDMRTVVYELEANKHVERLFRSLGFRAVKRWKVLTFGEKLSQVYYSGPSVGDLTKEIEQKRPWLKNRELI
ncbi:MAG: GNAT family N-acetyltransferase [bacterium]|nr:GNAT family N-acetyltransferase [bacterium]